MFRAAASMIDLFSTASELQSFCDRQGWRSCFIGGVAVQRWGEPRVTRDVDLTLMAGFGEEDHFIQTLLGPVCRPDPGRRDLCTAESGVTVAIAGWGRN